MGENYSTIYRGRESSTRTEVDSTPLSCSVPWNIFMALTLYTGAFRFS